MNDSRECVFCQIAAEPAASGHHRIWEDAGHVAFLSIFPNTEGVTVVIPRAHHPSYFAEIPESAVLELVRAARTVAPILDAAFETVSRTALVFEGFGVDHIHAKLFPLHGTGGMTEWRSIPSPVSEWVPVYPGHVSTHNGERADDEDLATLAGRIRAARRRAGTA